MTDNLYVLDEKGVPVIEKDIYKWGRWYEKSELRRVAFEKVRDSEVSTVFLGIDHNYYGKGPPVLWETMVFGGKLDQEQDRCSGSREQAESMHDRMVKRVKEQL